MAQDWLPAIYEKKIRSQRTRSYKLNIPKKENRADIQYTLLGIELKVGRKRFACPDLATARYLRVFARIGCNEFAVPYDITKISPAADEIETSWQRSLVLLERLSSDDVAARSTLIKAIRNEIIKIGPGDAMPLFDRDTKQRK
ncbi:MAG: hypothetical protein IPO41_09090 [Acidobacteria bacterium]|nr:hypothetical protein [Acidobacteriota bacterium]MBP9108284.1 hypothetical protein [Pyrinomonadaceae bacterium]